jgi:hypothetical protein
MNYSKIIKIIKDTEKNYDFGSAPSEYITETLIEAMDDASEVISHLEDNQSEICAEEVIYYFNAMKYLSENDNSLHESIALALEYGYELKDITSEVLASLLKTQKNNESFGDFLKELDANLEGIN